MSTQVETVAVAASAAQAGTEEAALMKQEGICEQCASPVDDHGDSERDGREVGAEIITLDLAPAV